MDKEQDQLQFLGFFSIFKESFNIILAKPKIFTYICLSFILPLSCISLAYTQFSNNLISTQKTTLDNLPSFNLNNTQVVIPQNFAYPSPIPSFGITYWLFNAAYIAFAFVFSLLYMAAVVYTIGCTYISKETTFKKVLTVLPKVCKRLLITFLCNFGVVLICSIVLAIVMFTCTPILLNTPTKPAVLATIAILLMIMVVIYFVGFVYMAIYWQLANVISIMENFCGFKAMKKSKQLIKGKVSTAIAILFFIGIFSMLIEVFIKKPLANKDIWIGVKIFYGSISIILSTLLSLYGIVVQTVFYFVCKSYHHENIDKSILADHLDGFLGEYVPLKNDAIEIERFHV